MTTRGPALIVHGGAGADPADAPDELREGVRAAVTAGWAALDGGGALDAVEAAVRVLEDHPRFNAGRGSTLTAEGSVETDASIMEGDQLRNGAVAAVSGIRNPISLARRILDAGGHSLFVGAGAVERARALGVPICDPGELVTDRQRERLAALLASEPVHRATAAAPGTVGAAALDRRGTLAAATSTGGMLGKLPGRVGDSALIGCGTYADSRLGAVSCTGDGEAIIRVVLARRLLDLLVDGGDPSDACRLAVELLVREGRGQGGLIAVDPRGRVGWAQSTLLMPVGFRRPDDATPVVAF